MIVGVQEKFRDEPACVVIDRQVARWAEQLPPPQRQRPGDEPRTQLNRPHRRSTRFIEIKDVRSVDQVSVTSPKGWSGSPVTSWICASNRSPGAFIRAAANKT